MRSVSAEPTPLYKRTSLPLDLMEPFGGAGSLNSEGKKNKGQTTISATHAGKELGPLREGDLSSLDAKKYLSEVSRIAAWIERNEHDAEDLAQDVLLRLLAARLRKNQALGPWARTTAIRIVSRRKDVDRARALREFEYAFEYERPPHSNDAFMGNELSASLGLLRNPYQAAIRNHYLRGMSYGSMANTANCSESLVRMHVSRGLRLLRDKLQLRTPKQ